MTPISSILYSSKNQNKIYLIPDPTQGLPLPPLDNIVDNQWVLNTFHMAGNSVGLTIAYFMQKTAVTFGGCMMGSEYLLSSFEELVDPLLAKLNLPTLHRTFYIFVFFYCIHLLYFFSF